MGSIYTGIELQDRFSNVLYGIMDAVNLATISMETMNQSMAASIDTSELMGARDAIDQATAALNALNEATHNGTDRSAINRPTPAQPPIDPYQWQSGSMEIFTNSGVERFQQEIESTNRMMDMLCETQDRIARRASGIDILPNDAVQDINGLNNRMQLIQERIQQMASNPLNMGTNAANMELERLREQLSRATQQQNELDRAMNDLDVERANAAYLRLLQTIGDTERRIRDGTGQQERFNNQIQQGAAHADNLVGTIKRAAAAYISLQGIGSVFRISDELTLTTARIDLMNDGLQTTEELQNKIYMAAERSRGSYLSTSAAVSKLGILAGDAFSGNDEIIAFTELLNKQFAVSGASIQESTSAMYQLTQAMAAGRLQGDEFRSIMENAPMLAQSIEDHFRAAGVEGALKDWSSEGLITAEIVKEALFSSADDINAKFENMPKTWGQIWQSMKNTALVTFQPILQRINDIANSEKFQIFVHNINQMMGMLANAMMEVFDLACNISDFISNNWSVIVPIIGGIVFALGLYTAALGANAFAQGISKAQEIIAMGVKYRHARAILSNVLAYDANTVATARATVAQTSFNTVLLACPVTWIVLGLIAIVAGIMALNNWLAKTSGVAQTGFGILCGTISFAGALFKNLGLTVANVVLGIRNVAGACAENTGIAFHNAIQGVISWWYDLLSTVINVVAGICAELNKIPFIEFDYSGLTSAADKYANKAIDAANKRVEYTSISDAFHQGYTTFDTFEDGWATKAFQSGVDWGDNKANELSKFFDSFGEKEDDAANKAQQMLDNLNNIDGNTGDIKDSLDITEEDLQYLKDIAEREVIDRTIFTTVSVDMGGVSNIVNEKSDLNSIGEYLVNSLQEQLAVGMEGV